MKPDCFNVTHEVKKTKNEKIIPNRR